MRCKSLLLRVAALSLTAISPLTAPAQSRENRESLRGLRALRVTIAASVEGENGPAPNNLITAADVQQKLSQAGVPLARYVDRDVVMDGEGRRVNSLLPVLRVTVRAVKQQAGRYASVVEVECLQDVVLKRDTAHNIQAVTWRAGGGSSAVLKTRNLEEVRAAANSYLDEFIRDFLAVNPKP